MRKIIPLLLFFVILTSGCTQIWAETRPIRELRIIETLGCDLAEEGVALSVYASKPELKLRQEAPSFRLAMDQMREQAASPALFFAHTQFILVGRAMAADDLAPVLDLVGRSEDMRLRIPLFLLRSGDAWPAVQLGKEDRNVTETLSALKDDMSQQGTGHAFTCGEILESLSASGAALAAACALDTDSLRPMGYGVLKNGKCISWITAPEDHGVDLLMNLESHGDVRLGDATLSLEDSEAEITPRWEGGALTRIDISLRLRASLSETDGRPGATRDGEREKLERQLSETVKGWIETLLCRSQALRADFLGLGGAIAERDPGRWEAVRADWQKLFPDLAWSVTVETTLGRTLDLQEPLDLGGAP